MDLVSYNNNTANVKYVIGSKNMSKKTWMGSNEKTLKRWVLYGLLMGAGMMVLVFLITSSLIGVEVRERCQTAISKYEGDCVEVLMVTVASEEESFRNRNYGIWALGQLGDTRAMPLLESMYTGNIPEREPYDDSISQYELKKAIALVGGGFNATAWVWRRNLSN